MQDWEKTLSATLTKVRVADFALKIAEEPLAVHQNEESDAHRILMLTLHPTKEIGFRASWIIETFARTYPLQFLPLFHAFFDVLKKQKNQSCLRHFTNVVIYCAGKKAPDDLQKLWFRMEKEFLVDSCFEWLIDEQMPVAVRVNCLEVLAMLRGEFDWVEDELRQQIAFLLRDGTAAMQSRGKKVLKELNQAQKRL